MLAQDTLEVTWGVRLLDEGSLAIPNLVVRHYRDLGIEHGEFGLICTILTYKHDKDDPYPTHDALAQHLHCSERQVRKWVGTLEAKGLLRVGRRRKVDSKQLGPMVYNFKPLVDAALRLVGESPLPEPNGKWEVEYREPMGPGPEVPVDTGPEVPVGTGPQVPLKRSLKRSLKDLDDDDLTRARGGIQTSPCEDKGSIEHRSKSATPISMMSTPSSLDGVWGVSRNLSGEDDFAWKESDSLVAYEAWNETAASLPSELPLPEPLPSLPLSAPIASTEGLPTSPTIHDVCDAVDRRMGEKLLRPYMTKGGEYQTIVDFLASGIPPQFILNGIDYTFDHFSDKHPNSFAYCGKIIAQLWANELEKAAPPQPIDWTAYQQPAQRRPSRQIRNSLGSTGQKSERDERYSAFYELFPDA